MQYTTFIKDADDTLNYSVNLAPPNQVSWLATGDSIASVSWIVDTGITAVSNSFTPTIATVLISGGSPVTTYLVQCFITTTSGLTKEVSFQLLVNA